MVLFLLRLVVVVVGLLSVLLADGRLLEDLEDLDCFDCLGGLGDLVCDGEVVAAGCRPAPAVKKAHLKQCRVLLLQLRAHAEQTRTASLPDVPVLVFLGGAVWG